MLSIYDLFVSPGLCTQIISFGLKFPGLATYRIYYNGEVVLICPDFDPFRLYGDLPQIKDYKTAYEEYPALTINDIEKIIPGLTISADKGMFCACGDKTFDIPYAESNRIADAADKVLLLALRERKISIEDANNRINSSYKKEA